MKLPWRAIGKWLLGVTSVVLVVLGWLEFGFLLWNSYQWLSWAIVMFAFAFGLYGFILIICWKSKAKANWLPKSPGWVGLAIIASGIGAIYLVGTTPYSPAVTEDFHTHKEARERVSRELLVAPEAGHQRVRLYDSDQHLATRGDSKTFRSSEGMWVYFPVLIHAIDNSYGFVYSPSGARPPAKSFFDVIQCRELEPNWFWISTT